MSRKIRVWIDWLLLGVILFWSTTLMVQSRRPWTERGLLGQSLIVLISPVLKFNASVRWQTSEFITSILEGRRLYSLQRAYEKEIDRLNLELTYTSDTVIRLERITEMIVAGDTLPDGVRSTSHIAQLKQELKATSRMATQLMEATSIKVPPLDADFEPILALVCGGDRDGIGQGLLISRGANYGIAPGMPVLYSGNILIGIVRDVTTPTAYVQLLSDPNSHVAARLHNSRRLGVVSGVGGGHHRLEFLARVQTSVQADNEMLVTSGLTGSLFPGGLLIGKLVGSRINESGKMVGDVEPALDYSTLEEVTVLVSRSGPRPPVRLPGAKGAATPPATPPPTPTFEATTPAATGPPTPPPS